MGIVVLYDIDVYEDQNGIRANVFSARSVRGAAEAFELVAEYLRRRRSPGKTPSCQVELTNHRVDAESLYKEGNAVVLRDGETSL